MAVLPTALKDVPHGWRLSTGEGIQRFWLHLVIVIADLTIYNCLIRPYLAVCDVTYVCRIEFAWMRLAVDNYELVDANNVCWGLHEVSVRLRLHSNLPYLLYRLHYGWQIFPCTLLLWRTVNRVSHVSISPSSDSNLPWNLVLPVEHVGPWACHVKYALGMHTLILFAWVEPSI